MDKNTVPYSQFIVNVDSKYYQERLVLKRLLDEISIRDEFYVTERNISSICRMHKLNEIKTILETYNLSRPNLDIVESAAENSFNRLSKVQTMRKLLRIESVKEELQKYTALITNLDRMDELLSQFCHEVKHHPNMEYPTLILGQNLGQRQLSPQVAQAILKGKSDPYGLHTVTSHRGIHFKHNPESPGQEFAMDCLNKLITGMGSSPGDLIKIIQHDVEYRIQASKTVHGINLRELLLSRPDLVNHVDSENYTFLFILGLLTNLNDGKPDNFIARLHESNKSIEIVGIDNDLAFADPVVQNKKGEHLINVRNVLFLFPQLYKPLHPGAREHVLSLSPEIVIFEWLRLLHKQNQIYKSMKNTIFSSAELAKLELPIKLRSGTVTQLYKDMVSLQAYLRENPETTHADVLERMQPAVYYFYTTIVEQTRTSSRGKDSQHSSDSELDTHDGCRNSLEKSGNRNRWECPFQFDEESQHSRDIDEDLEDSGDVLKIFDSIFSPPELSSLPGLNQYCIEGKPYLEYIKSLENVPGLYDFRDLRDQEPRDAIAELLLAVDFIGLSHVVQTEIMKIIIQVPFEKFVIADSDFFGDRELQFILDNSNKLQTLEIVRCPSITEAGVRLLLCRSSPCILSVIITDCPLISKSMEQEFTYSESVSLAVNPNLGDRPFPVPRLNKTDRITIEAIRQKLLPRKFNTSGRDFRRKCGVATSPSPTRSCKVANPAKYTKLSPADVRKHSKQTNDEDSSSEDAQPSPRNRSLSHSFSGTPPSALSPHKSQEFIYSTDNSSLANSSSKASPSRQRSFSSTARKRLVSSARGPTPTPTPVQVPAPNSPRTSPLKVSAQIPPLLFQRKEKDKKKSGGQSPRAFSSFFSSATPPQSSPRLITPRTPSASPSICSPRISPAERKEKSRSVSPSPSPPRNKTPRERKHSFPSESRLSSNTFQDERKTPRDYFTSSDSRSTLQSSQQALLDDKKIMLVPLQTARSSPRKIDNTRGRDSPRGGPVLSRTGSPSNSFSDLEKHHSSPSIFSLDHSARKRKTPREQPTKQKNVSVSDKLADLMKKMEKVSAEIEEELDATEKELDRIGEWLG
eukprot:TRINITY_DN5943_c0_g1_i2.p1 TRINITY_DN5943_c0_g1~~TRINITY_DN5943_c0_g1_i2.p1  ORF type:complete len:1269 (+),score=185.35 TRINITY_DN5943_c0_g1_i2:550-3807(+)